MPVADISRADASGNVGRSRRRTSRTVYSPAAAVTVLPDRVLPGCHSDRRVRAARVHGCTGVKPTGTIDAATIAALEDAITPRVSTAIGIPGPDLNSPADKDTRAHERNLLRASHSGLGARHSAVVFVGIAAMMPSRRPSAIPEMCLSISSNSAALAAYLPVTGRRPRSGASCPAASGVGEDVGDAVRVVIPAGFGGLDRTGVARLGRLHDLDADSDLVLQQCGERGACCGSVVRLDGVADVDSVRAVR